MFRASFLSVVCAAILLPSALSAQELPDRIIKYFPGKWSIVGPDQGETANTEWKLVAKGRAFAGGGDNSKTGAHFGFGRWHAADKMWAHDWADEKGGYGRLEVTRFENDTYYGKVRVVDEAGKIATGETRAKVIDADHFEYTVIAGELKLTSRWTRQK